MAWDQENRGSALGRALDDALREARADLDLPEVPERGVDRLERSPPGCAARAGGDVVGEPLLVGGVDHPVEVAVHENLVVLATHRLALLASRKRRSRIDLSRARARNRRLSTVPIEHFMVSCNFFVGQLLDLAEDEHGAEGNGHLLDGFPDLASEVRPRDGCERRVAGIGDGNVVDLFDLAERAVAPPFQEVRRRVHGDPVEPGVERGFLAEFAELAVDLEEDLLSHVFRVSGPADEVLGDRHHSRQVGPHDLLERGRVAETRFRDQVGFGARPAQGSGRGGQGEWRWTRRRRYDGPSLGRIPASGREGPLASDDVSELVPFRV